MRLASQSALFALLLTACVSPETSTDGRATQETRSFDTLPVEVEDTRFPKPMVPAHPQMSSADTGYWWHDQRGQYPDTFAITEPPRVAVRSPGEWENKQALLIAWTGNFADVVASIIQNARLTTEVTIVYDSSYALSQFKSQMAA